VVGVSQRLVAEVVPQIALSPLAGVGVLRLPEADAAYFAALPRLVEVDVLQPAAVEVLSASASMKVAVTNVWPPLAAELPGVLPHLGQVPAEVAYQVALLQMAMVGVLSWPLVVELPSLLPHLGQVPAEVAHQAALPQMAMVGVLSWPLLEAALPVAPAALWRQALGPTAAPAARALPAKAVQADVAAVVTVAADRACRALRLAWLSPGSSLPFAQPTEAKQDQSLQRSTPPLGPPGERVEP
jgi:hypothetical protein